jgi:hypothetical protein
MHWIEEEKRKKKKKKGEKTRDEEGSLRLIFSIKELFSQRLC